MKDKDIEIYKRTNKYTDRQDKNRKSAKYFIAKKIIKVNLLCKNAPIVSEGQTRLYKFFAPKGSRKKSYILNGMVTKSFFKSLKIA